MKRLILIIMLFPAFVQAFAFTFVPESAMQDSLMQMLARFTTYMAAQFQPCQEPNSDGETCGCFRSNSTMRSNEDGVRTNADMGMVCAFLCKYGRDKAMLPDGITWQMVEQMARQSLVFAYSTHKANRLKVCADRRYWGSTGRRDRVWESSLWAMSVAYQAWFLWDSLTESQRDRVYRLLKAECQYELERDIPTGFRGDTKAEENGWEVDVLAAATGLFPDDALAPRWRQRMLEFAVNCYSHPDDATDTTTVIAGDRPQRLCDLYRGANLYPDYTLQNHDYFHTSYQNVVIQELGEAAIILNAHSTHNTHSTYNTYNTHLSPFLLHHCREVCDSVLWWLALSDGELAMPNGNDWSLFLYDQLTSYSTMACLLRDADALMLENRAFQMIRHRQATTPDGSWLLRSDIGPRRMGVQAHRVMMTWLMHHLWSTADVQPSDWEDFRRRHAKAKVIPCQKVVRASTASRFSCFSWSEGLHSYTGYVAPHLSDSTQPEESNIIVPFKANNTGNILGWYEVEGRATNAIPGSEPLFSTDGEAWTLTASLLCNDSTLDHRFTICSTPGNALIYIYNVRARKDVTILSEHGGLMAVSMDAATRSQRRFAHWQNTVCIDNMLSLVGTPGKSITTSSPRNVNSILTTIVAVNGGSKRRMVQKGELVDSSYMVVYTGIDETKTRRLAQGITQVDTPEGWQGIVVPDVDGRRYLLLSHFFGDTDSCSTALGNFTLPKGQCIAEGL